MKRLLIPGALAVVALVATITLTITTTDVYMPEYVDMALINRSEYVLYIWVAGLNESDIQHITPIAKPLKFGTTYRGVDAGYYTGITFTGSLVVYINATNRARLNLYDLAYISWYSDTVGNLKSGRWGPFDVRIIQRTANWTLFRVEGRNGIINVQQPVIIRFP